ncbi:MAG: glycoside hydrolase family 66 protein [Lachnospiraceae bacterium]|nr:glycoside hydrolase family 66 protein [Lachnospiraceae bacterium]
MKNESFRILPDKAQYAIGQPVRLEIKGVKRDEADQIKFTVFDCRGPKCEITSLDVSENFLLLPESFSEKKGGYLVKAELFGKEIRKDTAYTAFDVAEHWEDTPRYGFLSCFSGEEPQTGSYGEFFRTMHLNAIQFYDWMYRHDCFYPEEDLYTDIMGRQGSMAAVRNRIDGVHSCGGKAIAYGAVYGAESFQEEHPECRYLHDNGDPMVFIDKIWLMDIHQGTAWRKQILSEYGKALDSGFDGIHMDQYGDPKEAFVSKENQMVIRDLADDFQDLINEAKETYPEKYFIFNAVNNWPVDSVAKSREDCVYIEVWSPNDTYGDLFRLIEHARIQGEGKQVILAAYLNPFKTDTLPNKNGATAQLAMATIFASGGFHLLLGEEGRILTEAYYPDNCPIGDTPLMESFRRYYDFITAYGEMLFPKDWTDVTMQYAGGINSEFAFPNVDWSPYPEAGKVWIRIYKRGREFSVRYVNFTGITDMNWNHTHPDFPVPKKEIETRIKLPGEKIEIRVMSPDSSDQEPVTPDYTVSCGEDKRQEIVFRIPELSVFAAAYIQINEI